jgi:cell wall assembly regulator SMI1
MDVRDAWKRIIAWADANLPEGSFVPAKRATKKQVEKLEKALKFELPEEVRQSYMIHNGTSKTSFPFIGHLMSLDEIELKWTTYCQWQRDSYWGLGTDNHPNKIWGPIKPTWWNPLRLPITDDDAGDGLMLDFDPPRAGSYGQVIHFDHEQGPLRVYSPDWGQLLYTVAEEVEKGLWYTNESYIWNRSVFGG